MVNELMEQLDIEAGTAQHGILLTILREGPTSPTVVRGAYRLAQDSGLRASVTVELCKPAGGAFDKRQLLVVNATTEQSWLVWLSDLRDVLESYSPGQVLRLVPIW